MGEEGRTERGEGGARTGRRTGTHLERTTLEEKPRGAPPEPARAGLTGLSRVSLSLSGRRCGGARSRTLPADSGEVGRGGGEEEEREAGRGEERCIQGTI
jgi:hypothetical protein